MEVNMKEYIVGTLLILLTTMVSCSAAKSFDTDTIKTADGDLVMTFIGHGTLMFEYHGNIIHIDPVSRYADYATLPKADLILLTHQHGDHLDMSAINQIIQDDTDIVLTNLCFDQVKKGSVMKNGDSISVRGLPIKAVPSYNLINKRDDGEPFHPRGMGNGYVITFADINVYIAGDTENIPEMKELDNIDIVFLPMNLPYTMNPTMVVDAVTMLNPGVLYPYHYGDTDVTELLNLMKEVPHVEVRIRDLR